MLRRTAVADGTISRRILHCGQLFPQFLRGQLEKLPEAQVGQLSDPAGHTASDSCGGRCESDGGSSPRRFRSSKPCVILRCRACCIRAALLTHSTRLLARHIRAALGGPAQPVRTNRIASSPTGPCGPRPSPIAADSGVVPDRRQGWRRPLQIQRRGRPRGPCPGPPTADAFDQEGEALRASQQSPRLGPRRAGQVGQRRLNDRLGLAAIV